MSLHQRIGEYIDMHWDDEPRGYYVRGHVDHDTAIATITPHIEYDDEVELGESRHGWGRTLKSTPDRPGPIDSDTVFCFRVDRLPGWSKVTEVLPK